MEMMIRPSLTVSLVLMSSFIRLANSQDCKQTHVEERLRKLEELIKKQNKKLENQENINRKLEKLIKTQSTKIDNQENINKNQQEKINRLLSMAETYKPTKLEIHANKSKPFLSKKRQLRTVDAVAFSTRLTTSIPGLGHHQIIIFNHVVTNVGNGYNANDGVFVAPVGGFYVFTWAISTNLGKYQVTELVKDGTVYGYSKADSSIELNAGNPDYSTATNTVVLQVNAGQHIWIRTGNSGNGFVDGGNFDTFSGWLLY